MADRDTRTSEVEAISYRVRMVDQQLKPRDITNTDVLDAMRTVPRHEFVPDVSLAEAYGDHPVPIAEDQTISQPYIVASMTQELELDHDARVLEIGTGCGYQTAVLAEIVKHVYSVEFLPVLHEEARGRLSRLHYTNVTTMAGDGSLGWSEHAPYDGIIVTAAAPEIPEALIEQLIEGGRMLIPISLGSDFRQELFRVRKTASGIEKESLYNVRFVSMRGRISEK
jgi:protein-L-isoaspartate(D-aspartate) O-methyltransferase